MNNEELLLLIAHCSLPIAHCSLPIAHCSLPIAHCLWAYLDLNQGPHAYQACALNHLSYRPNPDKKLSQVPHGLPRKEVIQPQVLLRLPCYDFTPIAHHTFGACVPLRFAQRLRVPSTFVV
jgi:hypothetical protein